MMEQADIVVRDEDAKTIIEVKPPRVPIPTYRWEDLRRARLRGGYPWTYLYKEPYTGDPHPEHYTMEEFRRTKSQATLRKDSTLDIQELANGSSSERGSVEPIITEAGTPEPPRNINRPRDASIVTLESAASSDNISQYLDREEGKEDELKDQDNKENEAGKSEPENSATIPEAEMLEPPALKETNGREERAKSEGPAHRKRKLSIESSYSRISLSRLGIMKKLQDARDKIKVPKLSSLRRKRSKKGSQKDDQTAPKEAAEKEKKPPKKELKPAKPEKPVYIHIPLKPPPGETDEFSYLEFGDGTPPQPSSSKQPDEPESSLDSPQFDTSDVQFIVLTPPSDDEVLVDASIPDTPSEKVEKFFESTKIEELKTLAKDVVNEIQQKPKLETVEECKENGSIKDGENQVITDNKTEVKEEVNIHDDNLKDVKEEKQEAKKEALQETKKEPPQETKKELPQEKKKEPPEEAKKELVQEAKKEPQQEAMVVDVEDGLRTAESSAKKDEKQDKVVIAAEEIKVPEEEPRPSSSASQVEEKRKSFRKKGKKKEDGERIYEDVGVPKTEEAVRGTAEDANQNLQPMGISQSMSVDEEKTYLDQKIIKSTSLEEDYNKWSKINDHEYEPVNPPPDDAPVGPPIVHVTDTTLDPATSPESSTTSLDRRQLGGEDRRRHQGDGLASHDLQERIDERFFTTSPDTTTTGSRTDCEVNTSQVDSSALEELPLQKDKRKAQGRFQQAIRDQAGRFKTKMRNIKRPSIQVSMPARPKFALKIEKPKINFPKIPDRTVIHMPAFTRKRAQQKVIRERQLSTESNAGDSKKSFFDFRTYPRIFKRKPKDLDETASDQEGHERTPPVVESATVPRTRPSKWKQAFSKADDKPKNTQDRWAGRDVIRIPLHSEESTDKDREESSPEDTASHTRFEQDIDVDDAFEKENQEIHDLEFAPNPRWEHGTFYREGEGYLSEQVTDLDNDLPEAQTPPSDSFDINRSKDIHSSESSLGPHHRGVLEEINSDEFFLRQKGISQDNIEVGMYLSSEIREAFKSPENVLSQMQDESYYDRKYDNRGSVSSLQEKIEKRTPIKKPKRKKTPIASQEQIVTQYIDTIDQFEQKDLPPPPNRPKRKNKKNKKDKENEFSPERVIPYQQTIPLDSEENLALQRGRQALENEGYHNGSLKYLDEDEVDSYPKMYENEQMQGIEHPSIQVTDAYAESIFKFQTYQNTKDLQQSQNEKPQTPPRKHRSLKSLSYSERDSILGDYPEDDRLQREQYFIPNSAEPPPVRPRRAHTRSQSRGTSQPDDDRTSRGAESIISENQVPCVEEQCVQDLRDPMGYAIIDKKVVRDPPLPPPRTPPRRRRSLKSAESDEKFSTVPRTSKEKPVRPTRNYSTLGPSRPPRNKPQNMTDEEKENVDITQYIEIEEEPSSHLKSGDVIQKMRDRPLPPPPRPPRKPRPLHDITQESNLIQSSHSEERDFKPENLDETEVSTQTEPLPEGFVCEEDATQQTSASTSTPPRVKRHLQTPTQYSYEESVTHASLIIEPLNGAEIIPNSEFSRKETPREHIITVSRENIENDEIDETSEVPEEFSKLRNPPIEEETQIPSFLKAHKLQISDLDVDRLTVNELLANRITVSQIDGVTIQVNEITSKGGALRVDQIELPSNVVQQIVDKLQSARPISEEAGTSTLVDNTADEVSQLTISETVEPEQKKTPIELPEHTLEVVGGPPQRPPRQNSLTKSDEDIIEQSVEEGQHEERPKRPPRQNSLTKSQELLASPLNDAPCPSEVPQPTPSSPRRQPNSSKTEELAESSAITDSNRELEVDEAAPPRPPHPIADEYFPSQPPASFYALRAQTYAELLHEDDIPLPPRRRRHQKAAPAVSTKSSSEDSGPVAAISRRRVRSPEPSIPQLTGQLARACGTAADRSLKRLITHITKNVLSNEDGQQDMHVVVFMLLLLIAGLILVGWGQGRTVIHQHHWEFFFPPKEL